MKVTWRVIVVILGLVVIVVALSNINCQTTIKPAPRAKVASTVSKSATPAMVEKPLADTTTVPTPVVSERDKRLAKFKLSADKVCKTILIVKREK